ncbi:hypothetical protein ACHQM5_019948 [Ranunculus cassubicifolius]
MSDYSLASSLSDQMEHRTSTHNLSREGSEHGSQMESGLFVTSFAAAIFIAAIVTIGVLFITLVTTLTVMLQSCQNSNDGLLEQHKMSYQVDYCRMFRLHAELNMLDVDEFPSICEAQALQYIREGQYIRDLNCTMRMIHSYFSKLTPGDDGLDVVLIDIDDILLSNDPYHLSPLQYRISEENNQVGKHKLQASVHIHELHSKLQASGWSLMFVTRKPEKLRNETMEELVSFGYENGSSLIMRSDDEIQMENWEFFSRRRSELKNLGFRIKSVISSHMDALNGPCLGERIFKLPIRFYYNLGHHAKNS